METASLILSIISLGIDIKTIISDHIMSNKTLDDLLNKAIQKARKDANIDSQYLPGKPLNEKTLNKVLLDLVIKHVNDESIDIPHWLLENEFYKFYDSLMQNVDFLNFLHQELESHQHLLQNEKLDEANSILKEIRNQIELLSQQQSIENEKLDTIDKTTKGIKEHVEKPKLPDWLVPYDIELSTNSKTVFLQDAHENLIRENKIYRKKETIETITNWLDSIGFCLIIAPEGRGKTFLSRIIAFDYHNKNTKIYFVDCRKVGKTFYNEINKLLFNWNKDKDSEYLLILENVHALIDDSQTLKKKIEHQTKNQEETRTNIKFLLNARPTIKDYDCFKDWEETINLNPDTRDIKEIVNLYRIIVGREPFESEDSMTGFIKSISPNDDDSNGANLRLLGIYMRTWQNNKNIVYVSDVTEKDIYNDFIGTYGLDTTLNRDMVLLFISSLFQFDVPVPSKAVRQSLKNQFIESTHLLNDLFIEGLLSESGGHYYLPHSVEAYFLFKAICYNKGEDYIEKTDEFARFFIDDFILKQNKPRKLENDFKALFSGLIARKEEFDDTIQYLTSEDEVKEIIVKINPGFVLYFFRNGNFDDSDALNEYYTANKIWLKTSILELSPGSLSCIDQLSHDVFKDIFKEPKDLKEYFNKNKKIFHSRGALKAYSDLGAEYKPVLIEHFKNNPEKLRTALNPIELNFIYRFFYDQLKYNIFKDIFKDPKDLKSYLRTDNKIFHNHAILRAFINLGPEYISALQDYYKHNIVHLKSSFLELTPASLYFTYQSFRHDLSINIVEDIFKDPKDLNNTKDLEDYLTRNNITLNSTTILKAVCDLGDPHKDVLKNFYDGIRFDYFLCSTKNDYRISSGIIDALLFSNLTFDIHRIDENNFYFAGIHWMDIQRFVYIIRKNMNVNNKQHSIEVVKAIIQKVLEIKGSLSHASAHDLSLFLTNIAAVDKDLFEKLINDEIVIKNIKYRLSSQKYSLNDLKLFSYFYDEEWFYRDLKKIVNRTLESLNEADEKDLSTFLGNMSYMNTVFYNDLIVNETVVGIAKKRFETFSFREDYLYLFGHFYSQDWCKKKMDILIDNADEEQQKVIKEWHDKVMKGLIEGGKTLDIGTLWDYIHNKFFSGQQNN